MEKIIYIYGAKGSGLKILEILDAQNIIQHVGKTWKPIFIDDDPSLGNNYFGVEVISYDKFKNDSFNKKFSISISIGNPKIRSSIKDKLKLNDENFPNLIHPKCLISNNVKIGIGNVFCQNTTIQPGCVVGSFNIFNVNAVMGPLALVGDYNTINSHTMLASESRLSNKVYIGMGAMLKQKICVGDNCVIGANTFLTKNLRNNQTISDRPKKIISKQTD